MVDANNGWIGARPEGPPTGRLLYRLENGRWRPVPDFPVNARRADVLDISPGGFPWVCTFNPESSKARDPRLNYFDGKGWTSLPIEVGIWPTGLCMVSDSEGWISGHFGELVHYKDGEWRKATVFPEQPQRYKFYLSDVEMSSPESGWAVGWSGVVLSYRHGKWEPVPVPDAMKNKRLWGVSLTTDGLPLVVGESGLIARFDGDRWHIWPKVTEKDLYEIQVIGEHGAVAVGNHAILHFDGQTWTSELIPVANDQISFQDVAMVSSQIGWIVGDGVILRADGRTPLPFRPVLEPDRFPMLRRGAYAALAVDFDGDQDLDLLTYTADSSRFFENNGASGFLEKPLLQDTAIDIGTLALGDLNGDRLPDLFVAERYRDHAYLYEKQKKGILGAATPSHVLNQGANLVTSNFVDINNDGDLDLYLGKSPTAAASDEGWRWFENNGAGLFRQTPELSSSKQTTAGWGDLNGDGLVDAVIFEDAGAAVLLNDGPGVLKRHQRLNIHDIGYQMTLADMDVDGDLDLIVCNQHLQIFHNDGSGNFELGVVFDSFVNQPASEEEISGICNVADVNHDGFPDLFLQTISDGVAVLRLFCRDATGTYQQFPLYSGEMGKSWLCSVFMDWDDDGDLDLYVGGDNKSLFFENTLRNKNFLKIRLEGVRSNRMAVGARVMVFDVGKSDDMGALRGHQQLGMGQAPRGQHSFSELHFGLDTGKTYDIRVRFPSGRQVTKTDVSPGETVAISEYDPAMRLGFLTLRYIRASYIRAELPLEMVKFLSALVMLVFFLRLVAPPMQARRIVVSRSVQIGLMAAFFLVMTAYTGKPLMVHLLQLVFFLAALFLLAICDRYYSFWRETRYLGHYRLLEQLGQGGMGVVYQARNVISRQLVALKTLHPEILEEEKNKIRFFREAAILKQMDHPNIVKIHESGEADGRGYISMELLRGATLKSMIRKSGPLGLETALGVMSGVADALDYMHRNNILHRDLKTENIFIVEPKRTSLTPISNNPPVVKLLDFGLSRDHSMKTMTRVKELLGTLAYMAPEQFQGRGVSPQSDIYGLGVIFFEVLTGQLPFLAENDLQLMEKIRNGQATPINDLIPDLPGEVARLIAKAMAPKAEQRFASAKTLSQAINRLSNRVEAGLDEVAIPTDESASSERGETPGTEAKNEDPLSDNTKMSYLQQWREDFAGVKALYQAGRFTDAQTLMLSCMATIEKIVAGMDEAEWATFSVAPEVEEFYDWLERFASH